MKSGTTIAVEPAFVIRSSSAIIAARSASPFGTWSQTR